MKFEFIEFYQSTEETKSRRGPNCLGTVHIYCIDCELDIRGIAVRKVNKNIRFDVPFFYDIDKETGTRVKYPLVRFTNQQYHQEMIDFLQSDVKNEIKKRLNMESGDKNK